MAAKGTLPSADVSAESEARKAWRFSMGIYKLETHSIVISNNIFIDGSFGVQYPNTSVRTTQ